MTSLAGSGGDFIWGYNRQNFAFDQDQRFNGTLAMSRPRWEMRAFSTSGFTVDEEIAKTASNGKQETVKYYKIT